MDFLGIYNNLNWIDIIYAALTAFVLTNLIITIRKMKVNKQGEGKPEIRVLDLDEMKKKCETLFPIETVYFGGMVFNKGMNVKITTLQKKIIEGVLIGKNNSNVLCIITPNRIIAHDMDKIESLTEVSIESR